VKKVDPALHDAVVALWTESRGESSGPVESLARRPTEAAVRAALARMDFVAFLAVSEGRPVGYAVATDCSLNPFAETSCVSIDQIYVAKDARRQGVAHSLIAAVTAHADRHGSEQVATSVPSGERDANRFFARLGFTPMTVGRVASTSALHRKLAGEGGARYTLDKVLVRRRVARLRAAHDNSMGAH
jgi:GNAT superfamily N-acetyltransferase